ncbi:peptide cleavage/export ABC transporter [Streptococcus sp. H49]|uniref:peptide cleavage/export ABC transporter n=1 Tax=Streptococcus huangxiaojuni TaxID=3237239 RepID=UPI0034A30A20
MLFRKNRKRIRAIKQQEQMDCGVTCLQMLLDYYGSARPLYQLREMTGTDREGVSALGLKKGLEALGFDCLVLKADDRVWGHSELFYPLIANILTDKSALHYVVVYGKNGSDLLIADPAKGKYRQSIASFAEVWTGALILAQPNESYQAHVEQVGGLLSFLPLLLRFRKLVLQAVLASLAVTLLSIGGSYYFQEMIDNVLPQQNLSLINLLSISLVCSYIFRTLFEWIKDNLLLNLGQKLNLEIILAYFRHLIHLPAAFFSSRKSGDLISRFLDGSRIIDALASAALSLFLDVSMFIAVGFVLFIQNTSMFLITCLSLPVYLLTILFFSKWFEKASEKEMQASAVLNSDVIESLNGIETVKSYQSEDYIGSKIEKGLRDLMEKMKKADRLNNSQMALKTLTDLLTSALVVWLGAIYVLHQDIYLGELITYNALLTFFTTPLQNIVNLQVKLQEAQVASKRLNEVLAVETESSFPNQTAIEDLKQEITISDVTFSYNLKAPILQNVTLKIPRACKMALVGTSGSGKSTLAKLLVKFYEAQSGQIYYDNQPVTAISSDSLRKVITYVPQETFFFNGSIYDNLIFGQKRQISQSEIKAACAKAQILDYIQSLPLGFETMVEEGGANLSGGQKKRLSIARALLSEAQIYIFDEVTSGMDPFLEKTITEELLALKEKMIIFITHSLPLSKSCDSIAVLEDGQIVEIGSYRELWQKKGVYHKMWQTIY